MVTVLDVVLEGRILRAFGTLADNSAHSVMVSISFGLFFVPFYNTTELLEFSRNLQWTSLAIIFNGSHQP